jgi:hypothetical protein
MATHKTERTTIRWTPEDLKSIKKRAEKVGVPAGRYIREVALGELPQGENKVTKYELIDEIQNIRSELNAIGNNMNQLAKVGNQTGSFNEEYFSEIRRAIFEMRKENHKALMELL